MKPWEKYQTATPEPKPWEKYQTATPEPKPWEKYQTAPATTESIQAQPALAIEDTTPAYRPPLEELPEVAEGGLESFLQGVSAPKERQIALVPVLMTTTDPREFGQIVTSAFPEIAMTEEPNDQIVLTNTKTGQVRPINKKGFSTTDAIQALGLVAAFYPAGAAATIPARIGGAALTEAGVQGAQAIAGGEFDTSDIALSAGLAGAAEAVLPVVKSGAQAVREMRGAKELGVSKEYAKEVVLPAVDEARLAQRQLEKLTGQKVDIYPAQLTMSPADLLKQRVLPQLDAGSQIAIERLEKQSADVYEAVASFVDKVVPTEIAVNAEKRARDAAVNFHNALEAQRSESFREIFVPALEEAAKNNTIVTINNTRNVLERLKKGHRKSGPTTKLIDDIEDGLQEAFDTVTDGTNLNALHNFKVEDIAQLVYKYERQNGPLSFNMQRKIKKIYSVLAKDLRNASKGYGAAMDDFIAKTPEIENFMASLGGAVSKVPDKDLITISAKIFDPRRTINEIDEARRIIESVDPEAWTAVVAKHIDQKIGGVLAEAKEMGDEAIVNVPGMLYRAIFGGKGNPKARRILYRSLNKEQKQNFRYLETVLRRTAAGRAQGSPTAGFLAQIDSIRKRLGVFRDILTRPLGAVYTTAEERAFEKNVRAMTQAAFNPDWAPRMARITKMSPFSDASARAMTQLLNDVKARMDEEEGASPEQQALPNESRM